MPVKSNLRDKLDDDVLDLSLSQLNEVPVKEIATLTKGTTLDLSNNLLTFLPENFPTLVHLIKLDLSKNQISELPEYFGQLKNLKHLDLYSNQLERLPVSFAQLKNLKWLDLKNNPLVPAVAQAAGPCITASDCALCAKKVVALLLSMQSQLERERQKRVIHEQKLAAQRLAAEEVERERIRAEKRAAKERRREEARLKAEQENKKSKSSDYNPAEMQRTMNGNSNGNKTKNSDYIDAESRQVDGGSGGWCWSLFMFLFGFGLVFVGAAIAMIWIYTGGRLDSKSVGKAIPLIRRDVDNTAFVIHKRAEDFYVETGKWMGPKASEAWKELQRRNDIVARWINSNFGSYFCCFKRTVRTHWKNFSALAWESWNSTVKPGLLNAWAFMRPYFQRLGEIIIRQTAIITEYVKEYGPVYVDMFYQKSMEAYQMVSKSINDLLK